MKILICGAAGFIGFHLAEKLVMEGHTIWGCDNLVIGSMPNLSPILGHPNFKFEKLDICEWTVFPIPLTWFITLPALPVLRVICLFRWRHIRSIPLVHTGCLNMQKNTEQGLCLLPLLKYMGKRRCIHSQKHITELSTQ